ncbi:hypothetical protein MSAN_01978800 [Mycena sanguinolenta]|uniref:CxC1-like cysteine cluster associated with KDZ transposases domain-containing protein n=1 Tax=Mycena sanguinolenta TaxID=230812 RepID=A0A8H6XLQ9_9AGAR|nr:hypothetical protein MSAN_01978800 [Mycena sanguinolenta]
MPLGLSKKQRHAAATSSPSLALEPGPNVPHHRRKVPAHIARRPQVLLNHGRTLTQARLPALLTQMGLDGPPLNPAPSSDADPEPSDMDRKPSQFMAGVDEVADLSWVRQTQSPDPGEYRRKRVSQWRRWQTEVLPVLLPLYARLLHETKSLRHLDGRRPTPSTCQCVKNKHKVSIVHFSSTEDVQLEICKCSTVPMQLMDVGAFGCAPILPTLAVDLRVLEFTANLFLQISPNNTAFTIALERVLATMGFQLDHQNSLRRRFGNCFMWYTHLRDRLKAHYNVIIENVRQETVPEAAEPPPAAPSPAPASPSPTVEATASPERGRRAERSGSRVATSSGTPTPASPTRGRGRHRSSSSSSRSPTPRPKSRKRGREPSADPPQVPFPRTPASYTTKRVSSSAMSRLFRELRIRSYGSYSADLMVGVDACFNQKHKTSPRDPPKFHPNTRFIPEDVAARTEEYVDGVRTFRVEEEEDGYEHDRLRLPRSVLDGCEASFKAADEKRQKASTEFFDDTALMALMCRHNRVLWVINMHSAGEKQFNVIALVETLFQHLPPRIRVGLLYDIACSLQRSCLKWNFLSRWMDRIAFAVSVFHAFGHEWACQLLYHPRKRVGFGLTNGEGAERFWKSIQHLIPHLRISGYHNRLYTLDAQMEHADEMSLLRLGEWIRRHHAHCVQKRSEATKAFAEAGKPMSLLRAEWKKQVAAQTKPLPRRTQKAGEKAVEAVLLLQKGVETRKVQVRDLRQKFVDAASEEDPNAAILCEAELRGAEAALEKSEGLLRRKEAALGVQEKQELKKMAKSEYLRLRMNARALKLRLRERLRARKFELDAVERAYRRLVNDSKLHAHTESAVKRREPTIAKVATEYNKLCTQITKLIADGKAPRGSIAPVPIPTKGLWQLDVDDVIFQDVGLDDGEDESTEPPLWLCDEKVRSGIKAMLELDRCNEEEARLRRELRALRVWFAEEWKVVKDAIDRAESDVDKYHLQLRQDKLVRLCATWEKHLPQLVHPDALPPWGPSPLQLSKCNVEAHLPARGEDRHYGEEEGEESGGEDDDFGMLEAVERADIYRNEPENDF